MRYCILAPLAASLALGMAGCSTTHRVARTELTRLAGFDATVEGAEVTLAAEDGTAVKFDKNTRLALATAPETGVPVPPLQRYQRIEVDDQRFLGVPAWNPSRSVLVPMEAITAVRVTQGDDEAKAAVFAVGVIGATGLMVWVTVTVTRALAGLFSTGSEEDEDY
jgi:hypothetical protein